MQIRTLKKTATLIVLCIGYAVKAQSTLILGGGIGLKASDFTFSNSITSERFKESVEVIPSFQVGMGYQYTWHHGSQLWTQVNYTARDTRYAIELRSETNELFTATLHEKLRFVDVLLGYGFRFVQKRSWSFASWLGGLLAIPVNLTGSYKYPNGSTDEADATFLPNTNLYGAQLEPIFTFKLYREQIDLFTSLPMRLFWVQTPAPWAKVTIQGGL